MKSTQPQKRYLPSYTVGEEIANSITHGIGALLAIAGSAVLIVFAVLSADAYKIVASSIFSLSLIMMFTMSTMYHSLTNEKAKYIFRIFDHTSIFILIAGTYTPLTLVALRGTLGWSLFGLVWLSTVIGIILNCISVEKFKKLSMICYVGSGWCIIFAILPLIKVLSTGGILLLIGGGVCYTVGLIFYKLKSIPYMHSIWHLFVLGGAVFHYFCILFYVVR